MLDTERLIDYWPALIRVARRTCPLAGEAAWEDIAGQTLEEAVRYAARFKESGDPYGWLATIARRRAIDYLNHTLNREVDLASVNRARIDAGSEQHTTTMAVRAVLERLPKTLAPYAAGRLSGLGVFEAGARLHLSQNTAMRRESELRVQFGVLMGDGVARQKCKGQRYLGVRCGRWTSNESGYCRLHIEQAELHEEAS